MDAITFQYLISLTVSKGLNMCLMDVVTTYLYGFIDTNVNMKIPERFKLLETINPKPQNMYLIKIQRFLYGLKQSRRIWYNRLSEHLFKEGDVSNPICPCVFIKKSKNELTIIAIYVVLKNSQKQQII